MTNDRDVLHSSLFPKERGSTVLVTDVLDTSSAWLIREIVDSGIESSMVIIVSFSRSVSFYTRLLSKLVWLPFHLVIV